MNDMTDQSLFGDAMKLKRSLDALHAAHPDCPYVKAHHARLERLFQRVSGVFSPGEVTALGGGTPKTDPAG